MGITLCLQPLYFSEITPENCKGFINTMTSCLVEFGFGLGSVVALPTILGTLHLWPWLFWIELIPNAIALLILRVLPESPKTLLMYAKTCNNYLAVESSLKFFDHKNIPNDIEIINGEIQLEKTALSMRNLFEKAYLKRALLISIVIQIAVQFCGDGSLSYFSTLIFLKSGLPENVALYCTVIVSLQTGVGTVIAAFLTDKIGRKKLLLTSLLIMDFINIGFVILLSFNTNWARYMCIFAAVLMNLTFGLGPSAVQFSITSELMPYNAKSAAQSLTMLIGWFDFIFVTFIFLPLANLIYQYIFLTYAFVLLAAIVYLYICLPETKNRTLIEIAHMLGYDNDM